MKRSSTLLKKLSLICVFLFALSCIQIFILFLSDFYSAALFLLKSMAFQTSLILIGMNILALLLIRPKKSLVCVSIAINLVLFFIVAKSYSFSSVSVPSENAFNIVSFSALTRTRNGADINAYLDQIEPPEIFCLQEVTYEDTSSLTDYYPGFFHTKGRTLAIASKWPIDEQYSSGWLQTANVHTDFGELLVVNVHMPRPYRTQGIDNAWALLLKSIVNQQPAILCGDFNMTPYSSMYERITRDLGYQDAQQVGQGFGFTFPYKQRRIAAFGPQFRIDYIFTKGLNPVQSEVFGLSGLSDHKAVSLVFQAEK